ncbi:MAG: group III truncated hemoglobin [Beijerinckiaceae bacterium]
MTEDNKIAQAAEAHGVSIEDEIRARAIIEKALEDGVARFYEIVRDDALIGPIFLGSVHDFPAHMKTMVDFWSRMTLGTERYAGMPLPPHVKLDLTPEHFERWLAVWKEAAFATMPEPLAELVTQRAANMSAHWIAALQSVREQQEKLAADGKDRPDA